jgi:hypothetical protein
MASVSFVNPTRQPQPEEESYNISSMTRHETPNGATGLAAQSAFADVSLHAIASCIARLASIAAFPAAFPAAPPSATVLARERAG